MKQVILMDTYEYESNFFKCCGVLFLFITGLGTNMKFRINFLHIALHILVYSCLWLRANRLTGSCSGSFSR